MPFLYLLLGLNCLIVVVCFLKMPFQLCKETQRLAQPMKPCSQRAAAGERGGRVSEGPLLFALSASGSWLDKGKEKKCK